ncbi:MAG: FAD-dependent oxidoreductase, partial [Bacteroidales bacterium]|nr:FAD-dependent oxidoreductase [Bacteroidales bacterium]
MEKYDVIIIGAGAAGLTAGIYAARSRLKTLVIGKKIGGYIFEIPLIENYTGFKEISGMDLAKKMQEQAQAFGVKIKEQEVKQVKKIKNEFEIKTEKETYKSKTLILALGSKRRKLNVKSEDNFIGKGVTYCVTCDAPFFKDKDIAIIGAGDSAVIAALIMLKYANKIYMIDVEEKPRAKAFRLEQLKKRGEEKVKFLSGYKVNGIKGKNFVNSIEIQSLKTKEEKKLSVQGIIIEIGMTPLSDLTKQLNI